MWENLKLGYTSTTGNPLLREEIARVHDVSADDVNVVVPQEGIYMAMNCLAQLIARYTECVDHISKNYFMVTCFSVRAKERASMQCPCFRLTKVCTKT